MELSFYEASTGKLVGDLSGPEELVIASTSLSPEPWIKGYFDPEKYYVTRGVATLRPEQSSELIGFKLLKLPVPCTIRINERTYPCHEREAELTFDQPGTYKIAVEAWPYIRKEFTIENPTQ